MYIIYILYHFIAHANTYCKIIVFGRRLNKLEKLVSDSYLLYLANKNMFKLTKKKVEKSNVTMLSQKERKHVSHASFIIASVTILL